MVSSGCWILACFLAAVNADDDATIGSFLGALQTPAGNPVVVLKVPLPQGHLTEDNFIKVCNDANATSICQGGPSCSQTKQCTALSIEADYCGYPMMGLAKQVGFKDPFNSFFSDLCIFPGSEWTYTDGVCGGESYYTHANDVSGQRYALCAKDATTQRLTNAFLPEVGACEVSGDCMTSPSFPRNYPNAGFCKLTVLHSGTLAVQTFATEDGDTLAVAGQRFDGTTGPDKKVVKTGDAIVWQAVLQATTSKGWKICLQRDQSGGSTQQLQSLQQQVTTEKAQLAAASKEEEQLKNQLQGAQDDASKKAAAAEAAATQREQQLEYDLQNTRKELQEAQQAAAVANSSEVQRLQRDATYEAGVAAGQANQVQALQTERKRLRQELTGLHYEVQGLQNFVGIILIALLLGFVLRCWCCSVKKSAPSPSTQLAEPLLKVDDLCDEPPCQDSEPFEPRVAVLEYKDDAGRAAKVVRVEAPGREAFTGRRTVRGSVHEIGTGIRLSMTKEPDMQQRTDVHLSEGCEGFARRPRTWERTFNFGEGLWTIVGPVSKVGEKVFDGNGVWEVHVAQVGEKACAEMRGRTFSVCPHHDLSMEDDPEDLVSVDGEPNAKWAMPPSPTFSAGQSSLKVPPPAANSDSPAKDETFASDSPVDGSPTLESIQERVDRMRIESQSHRLTDEWLAEPDPLEHPVVAPAGNEDETSGAGSEEWQLAERHEAEPAK